MERYTYLTAEADDEFIIAMVMVGDFCEEEYTLYIILEEVSLGGARRVGGIRVR